MFHFDVRALAKALSASLLLLASVPVAAAGTPPRASGTERGGWAVPILVYHRFDPAAVGPTTVLTSTFEGQVDWLQAHGYRITPLDEVVRQLAPDAPRPSGREAVITVDDGHESVFTQLYPLIVRRRLPITLFIYPSAISNAGYALTWAQLKQMQASGLVDIESHTYWHPNFRTERRRRAPADYQAFVDLQLNRSRSTLEARTGRQVSLLAWPFGIVDAELEAAAKRDGYAAAFAYEGGPARAGDDPFALPRIPITESDRGRRLADKLRAMGEGARS